MIEPRSCRALAHGCEGLQVTGPDPLIRGLSADSRQVAEGTLFAALPGVHTSGNHFVQQALEAGAVAILHDGRLALPDGVTQLCHPQPRQALAWLAAAFYGHPARRMTMIAITGTNGKTSTAAMIEAILNRRPEQRGVGVIGTTGIRHPGGQQPNPMTTPDPVALQGHLRAMADQGCDAVVMEVSSHALDQFRTAGIPWRVAVFTHLTRDHLDYHGSEQAYFDSKAALFLRDAPATAVIGIDEPWGALLAERCAGRMPLATFRMGCETPPLAQPPTPVAWQPFCAEAIELSWLFSRFRLRRVGATLDISLPCAGRFQIANAMAAAATGWQLGLADPIIVEGLRHFQPAPGRMQLVQSGQPFAVVVDYAHTPDALQRVLQTARTVTKGRIITVFGCGGERDTGKRTLMGQVAARLAEHTIVTDDNPRSEAPRAIRQAILEGCRQETGRHEEVADRDQAIGRALALATPEDAVIIAGKGHETVQITADGPQPFDDVQTARNHLARMGYSL
ncbi:MAG: UDP-N-acetylmuramoyl-L-alanyl-D-glutamate--2,6-diaminopimelate ligase [Magnetococcus sp. MYC-9]